MFRKPSGTPLPSKGRGWGWGNTNNWHTINYRNGSWKLLTPPPAPPLRWEGRRWLSRFSFADDISTAFDKENEIQMVHGEG